ncbi:MAG TPA: hypothetical protein EYF97_06870 [Gammaproteobacteria bacterium]|jgi:uncharacterized membrane protein YczE|nr:hypothetical protein [Gammaproteobacteria bacterium]HIK72976.1 hypothetical protein [Gammaproteobacteria bacterium]
MFAVKTIPVVLWSSDFPLNYKPRFKTMCYLILGLFLFGLGEAILIGSGTGVSPWTVLAQGISNFTNWTIGFSTFIVSLGVLIFWFPLKQQPGIGTILNLFIIAGTIDLTLPYLPSPNEYSTQILQAAIGIMAIGLGSGFYLTANLGPGPRDGLMVGLQKKTGLPIITVRTALEFTVVISGWMMGGLVGLGTIMFVFGIGPSVAGGLYLVGILFRK